MPQTDYIEPASTADFVLTVTLDDGTLVDDATVTCTVISPRGQVIEANASAPAIGSGTGQYLLLWEADWTVNNTDKPIEGEYLIIANVVRAGRERTRRFRIPVRYDDVD